MQDEVTQKIVSVLAVKLTEGEQDRLIHKDTENIKSYDYVLRGLEFYFLFIEARNIQNSPRLVKKLQRKRRIIIHIHPGVPMFPGMHPMIFVRGVRVPNHARKCAFNTLFILAWSRISTHTVPRPLNQFLIKLIPQI